MTPVCTRTLGFGGSSRQSDKRPEDHENGGGSVLARPNSFVVSLEAIRHNVALMRRTVGPGVRLYAALKANAYGFGLERVARTVEDAGVAGVGVADLEDAWALREAGFRGQILLYAGTLLTEESVRQIQRLDVVATVTSPHDARVLQRAADGVIPALLKVDVGLERLGVEAGPSAVELLARIDDLSRVRLAGVYTHMHSFGGPDARDYARWQFDRFLAVLEQARARDRDDLLLMASSSFAMQMTADMNLNAVDPGHLVFGLHPPGPTDALPGLRQAIVELTSRFVQVKDVERSAFTSCAPFPPAGVRRIGVLPIGRADGFHLVNAGHVLVGARRAPILGDVMAEYARVDLTGIAAGVGDEAVAIGCRGGAAITPEDVAGHQRFRGPADIPLSVSPRVHRSYQQADGAPLSDRTSSHPEARELL